MKKLNKKHHTWIFLTYYINSLSLAKAQSIVLISAKLEIDDAVLYVGSLWKMRY